MRRRTCPRPLSRTAWRPADEFYSKDKIQWECDNGGVLWTDSAAAGYGGSTSFPSGFCSTGFSNLNAAFIVALLVDLGFQVSNFVPYIAPADCRDSLPRLSLLGAACIGAERL